METPIVVGDYILYYLLLPKSACIKCQFLAIYKLQKWFGARYKLVILQAGLLSASNGSIIDHVVLIMFIIFWNLVVISIIRIFNFWERSITRLWGIKGYYVCESSHLRQVEYWNVTHKRNQKGPVSVQNFHFRILVSIFT